MTKIIKPEPKRVGRPKSRFGPRVRGVEIKFTAAEKAAILRIAEKHMPELLPRRGPGGGLITAYVRKIVLESLGEK